MDFSSLSTSTEEGAEIMTLLGLAHYDLDNPRKFSMAKDITSYFNGKPDARSQILKILSKGMGQDKLDIIWTFVELQKEKERAIKELDPDHFEEDIVEQIKTGILTKDNIARIKKDIEVYDNKLSQKRKEADELERINKDTVDNLFIKPNPIDILSETKKLLNKVEDLNKELSFYE